MQCTTVDGGIQNTKRTLEVSCCKRTVVLLEQGCAAPVALLGHFHPGGGVVRTENRGEAEVPLPAPPALSLGRTTQIRMLRRDLCAYRQLVRDVLHSLWQHK